MLEGACQTATGRSTKPIQPNFVAVSAGSDLIFRETAMNTGWPVWVTPSVMYAAGAYCVQMLPHMIIRHLRPAELAAAAD